MLVLFPLPTSNFSSMWIRGRKGDKKRFEIFFFMLIFFVLCFALGVVNVLLTTPLWVVNTRLKLQGAKFRNEDIVPTNYRGIIGKHLLLSSTKGKFMKWNVSRTLKTFVHHEWFHPVISVLLCHFAVMEFCRKPDLAICDGNLEFAVCSPVSKRLFAGADMLSYR